MEIKAANGKITSARTEAVIVYHFEGVRHPEGETADVDRALDRAITRLIRRGNIKGKLNEATLVHCLDKLPSDRVVVTGLGKKKELTAGRLRGALAETLRLLRRNSVRTVTTVIPGVGVNKIQIADSVQAVTEGAILGLYTFRRHITKKEDNGGEIEELRIVGGGRVLVKPAIERGTILAEAANRARDLINEPANFMTPAILAETARAIAADHGLEVEVMEKDRITELGMGGLLGVSQGSQQPPRFIVLRYKGNRSKDIDVALVGKGLTFDSGGIDIKPQEGMHEMKGDMSGGAAVMASMTAIARLKPEINVTALVPATENMPGGGALKPGDIITAMNGKTIEVLNTDAEGRLVLADALSYAVKQGAKAIIDVATLTGACHVALGDVYSGAFTNNQPLLDKVVDTGKETGELLWQLPMDDEYREQLKSDIADIKNIGGRYGGAITAAKFLAEFVGDTPWVHLDIAGTFYTDKDKGHVVKGGTGVPVRTLVNYVMSLEKK
jgi:leucyl aminopeptidase